MKEEGGIRKKVNWLIGLKEEKGGKSKVFLLHRVAQRRHRGYLKRGEREKVKGERWERMKEEKREMEKGEREKMSNAEC
ncbi:hypothetical protein [Belliella aquatica]|uniref:hypothetical protein n=1 Tax=Belliella aquatica TaxID=1323734 RepID=UPI00166ADE26|nr:hypothetical protein [Belliella aquatica]MCH7404962.1 hypothetical protein [Belliella aquatica]